MPPSTNSAIRQVNSSQNLCRGPYRPTHISSLRDSLGNIKTTQKDINGTMLQYYSSLYRPDPINPATAQSFLEKVTLSQVSPSQLEALNAPISLHEISTTIKNLAPSKAPGPDGFTGEFYKSLQPLLECKLHEVYQHIWSEGTYLPTGNQAIIKLLAKKGKDPQEPGSYRPISLLNLDVKILSKDLPQD